MIISIRGERLSETSNPHKPKREEARRGGGAEKRKVRTTVPPKGEMAPEPRDIGQLGHGGESGCWAPPPWEMAVLTRVVMTIIVMVPVTVSQDYPLPCAAFHAPAAADGGTMARAGS